MSEQTVFRPPRRRGLIFQIGAALTFSSAGGLAFYMSMEQDIGLNIILYLLVALIFLAPVPLIVYRAVALGRATYQLEREGLRLRWGLRVEDIPLNTIEWVRPAKELGYHLSQPRFSWPGALLGLSHIAELGTVEFIAAESDNLMLIATPSNVFAISPANPRAFMRAYQRTSEMGSLSPMAAFSAQPAMFMRNMWRDPAARFPVLFAIILTLTLLIATITIIPARPMVSLGFDPSGKPLPPVSGEKLLLLPTLSGIVVVISISIGLFYYRHEDQRMPAYVLMAGACLTPLLLSFSLLFIK